MYCIVFVLIITLICVGALNDSDIAYTWQKYKEEYGKTYRSPVQLKKRYEIFKENLKKIEEHNLLYDQGKSTYMEGINAFTDWTTEEFLNYVNKGLIDGPNLWGDFFKKIEDFKSPQSVDWRNRYAVTDVKNQGGCRSGWAFSATGALEGQLGLKGDLITLSEQNLIDCSQNSGCHGGLMNTAFDYIRKNGIQSQISYPYINSDGTCTSDASKVITKISGFIKIPPNEEEILQQAIATTGPISSAIHVTESLQRYKQGILDDNVCKNDSSNHGVLIVGYGTESQRDYYIVKNSWGVRWGEDGYFKLPRNENNKCGVALMASFPVL